MSRIKENAKIENIENNLKFLKQLGHSRSERRRQGLLSNATAKELESIVEVCYNMTGSRFRLSNKQRTKLIPHKDWVRAVGRCRCVKRSRRLVQSGNGAAFSALLIPVISELIRYIGSRAVVNKNE